MHVMLWVGVRLGLSGMWTMDVVQGDLALGDHMLYITGVWTLGLLLPCYVPLLCRRLLLCREEARKRTKDRPEEAHAEREHIITDTKGTEQFRVTCG